MAKKLTQEQFIQKAINTHGNKFDYSKVKYEGSNVKITIICKKHGEFYQNPGNHLYGSGCIKCSKEIPKKKLMTFETFVKKANQVHNNKYKYCEDSYKGASKKVAIICEKHGKFFQSGVSHLQGFKCKKCGVEDRVEASKTGINKFIEKSKKLFGEKFDYSNFIYKNCDTKSKLICKIHGKFEITPFNHLYSKTGCTYCGYELRANIQRKLPKELSALKKKYKRRAKLFLNTKNMDKKDKYLPLLGCSWQEFKNHLEDNPYGFTIDDEGLDLDHIVPLSKAKVEDGFYKLSHYTNFQLLPSYYNQHIKRDKQWNEDDFKKWYHKKLLKETKNTI